MISENVVITGFYLRVNYLMFIAVIFLIPFTGVQKCSYLVMDNLKI